jgi:uncharacterized membrane protein
METEAINYYYLSGFSLFFLASAIISCIGAITCYVSIAISNKTFNNKAVTKPLIYTMIYITILIVLIYTWLIQPTEYLRLKKYNFIACNDTYIKNNTETCLRKDI